MGLASLAISGLRCFEQAALDPAPGMNLVIGKNASGKTSLLEAIFLLGRGRSFRTARREAMIREGGECLRVVGRLADGRVLGVEAGRGTWSARAGGEPITQLAQLAGLLPVQLMDPEVHRLVQEGPGERRRYLDWATFHVKPGFLDAWRDYQRALRQRNAALKGRQGEGPIIAWERALAENGAALDRFRRETVAALQAPVRDAAARLLGAELVLEYRPGHPAGQDLAEALAAHRDKDRRAGMTQIGPHRADLAVSLDDHKARGWVSRGQQKLVAAAMVLGQARQLAALWGERAVLLVDDPVAELDAERAERLLSLIDELPFQVFLTALDAKAVPSVNAARTFHVEQGKVRQVV
ncbi:MAG: DNA replication/repair protein RecF [Gammaproteobacteria bacterium]